MSKTQATYGRGETKPNENVWRMRRNNTYLSVARQRVQSSRIDREGVEEADEKEPGETREWMTLKATAEKLGQGRRNRRVTEKMGEVVQLISPPGDQGNRNGCNKKRPDNLREKIKSPTRGPKQFQKSTNYDNM
jgi:hypothetical protein